MCLDLHFNLSHYHRILDFQLTLRVPRNGVTRITMWCLYPVPLQAKPEWAEMQACQHHAHLAAAAADARCLSGTTSIHSQCCCALQQACILCNVHATSAFSTKVYTTCTLSVGKAFVQRSMYVSKQMQ